MSDNKNNNLEHKLEALGKGVNVRYDFTQSVMAKVRQCPQPKAASVNRFRRLIMEKPILKWLPTATAAAILIIVMMILPSSNSGIVLADVLQKFNNSSIIKINAVQNKDEGEVINAQFWLDVDRQIIIAQQSDDLYARLDIGKKQVVQYVKGDKAATIDMTEDMLKTYSFDDGDMMGLLLRVLGNEVPGLKTDINAWENKAESDGQIIFVQQVKSGKWNVNLQMTVDKATENLIKLESTLKFNDGNKQSFCMEFEYPEALPELYETEAEMEIVEDQLEKLDTESGRQSEIQQVQKPTGTLLAEVMAKLNGTKIIKMNVDQVYRDGKNVKGTFWLDVVNQIIVSEANIGMKAVINLNTGKQKVFVAGNQAAEAELPEEMIQAVRFEGNILNWMLKIMGKAFPGLENDLDEWEIKYEDAENKIFFTELATGEKISLVVSKKTNQLIELETEVELSEGKRESQKVTFEYPDTLPKVALNEIESARVTNDVERLGKGAKEFVKNEFILTGKFLDNLIVNMKQQRWLYQYSDNGSNISQWWICPEGKVTIHDYNGDVTYRDYKKNEVLTYWKKRNEIEQAMLTPSGMDVDFDDNTMFDRPYQELEMLRRQIEYYKTEPVISGGQYRGHNVRILKYRASDEKLNIGDDGCWLIMYLDADQDLLRGYIQWCHLSVGPNPTTAEYIGVDRIEQAYDYPEPGPQSIYDVGVPKDAKYLDRLDEKYVEFLETYKSHKERGLRRIACIMTEYDTEMGDMVTWVESRNNPDGPISKLTEPLGPIAMMFDVFYVNGNVYRMEHRFNLMDQLGSKQLIQYWPKCRQELGYTFDSQLNWLRERADKTFSSIEIFDGKYQYHLAEYDKWKYSKTAKELYDPMIDKGKLEERTWPDINIKAEIAEDDYAKEHNLLCIRYEQKTPWQDGIDVFTYYLNPEKDYLCHKDVIEWAGSHTQVHEVEEYQQVNGLWYPRKIRFGSSNKKDEELKFDSRSILFIDESPEFDDEMFDGTYVESLYEKYKNEDNDK